MCFGAQRGPHFIAWQGQTPGRAHKGTAGSSVSARPPSHHILQSAGRAGSLSPAPCPVAEPSTFLCARGTTEDLTVPLCSVRQHPLPRVRPPRQGIYSPRATRPVPARRPPLPNAPAAWTGTHTQLQRRCGRAGCTSAVPRGCIAPSPMAAWCPAPAWRSAHFSPLNTKSLALHITCKRLSVPPRRCQDARLKHFEMFQELVFFFSQMTCNGS